MNRLIRYLTFSAPRPTFYYETGVYMTFRVLLACAVFFASAWTAPVPARIWMFVSALVAVVVAWSAQTARSGAARKAEERTSIRDLGWGDFARAMYPDEDEDQHREAAIGALYLVRRRLKHGEAILPCEDALRRAANIGSFCAALAPAIALGSSLTSAALGTTRGLALVAAVLAAFQGVFDAAWSFWIYPAWRRRYTRERDRLRLNEHLPVRELLRRGGYFRPDVAAKDLADHETRAVAEDYPSTTASCVNVIDEEHDRAAATRFLRLKAMAGGADEKVDVKRQAWDGTWRDVSPNVEEPDGFVPAVGPRYADVFFGVSSGARENEEEMRIAVVKHRDRQPPEGVRFGFVKSIPSSDSANEEPEDAPTALFSRDSTKGDSAS